MPHIPAALWVPFAEGPDAAERQSIVCALCARRCVIPPGGSGVCKVRRNFHGRLFSLAAASLTAAHLDPVEKKPLFHFLPGSLTLSLGAPGCTMRCSFCQNHTLSQRLPPREGPMLPDLPRELPLALVEEVQRQGAASIAYTYSEPTLLYELIMATAPLARKNGLASILISNGYQSRECLESLRPHIQAANFDLKAFSDTFYREYCGARLEPVLETLRLACSFGWWVEITTLLIPGLNDSLNELREIAGFIRRELGAHVPWHVSRFHPAHKMLDRPPTPLASVERALLAGEEAGLEFVYAGNIPGHPSESTRCPRCGRIVIRREGYALLSPATGLCPDCGASVPGVWTAKPA